MSQVMSQVLAWASYLREHPALTGGVVVVLIGFYFLSVWKPKHTRDAENRLREIRDETHDYYRHQRPPGH